MSVDRLACRVLAGFVLLLTSFTGPSLSQGFAGLSRGGDDFTQVTPGSTLEFPQDFGAHPDYRIEWWYLTADVEDARGMRIPTHAGHLFRDDAGHRSDLMSATIPR
jgi:predicted secreted hydrolase